MNDIKSMEDNKTKFMIVDGNSLGCRAALAFNPNYGKEDMKSTKGIPTGTVVRFMNMFCKILKEIEPTHIVVTWDTDTNTFRKQLDDSYKANRQAIKDTVVFSDMYKQFQIIKLILEKIGIHSVNVQGFEGDDIVGSYAKVSKADKNYIITGDRDSFQLVDNKTVVIYPKHGFKEINIVDEDYIKKEYELDTNQFISFKMLQGDSSDNIKGIDGCGPKTAIKLLHKFGSAKNIYNAKNEEILKESNKRVAADIDNWRNRFDILEKLVTIRKDVKLPYSYAKCKIKKLDWEAALPYIEELNMNQLASKIRMHELYGQDDNVEIQLELW